MKSNNNEGGGHNGKKREGDQREKQRENNEQEHNEQEQRHEEECKKNIREAEATGKKRTAGNSMKNQPSFRQEFRSKAAYTSSECWWSFIQDEEEVCLLEN